VVRHAQLGNVEVSGTLKIQRAFCATLLRLQKPSDSARWRPAAVLALGLATRNPFANVLATLWSHLTSRTSDQ
jgi:hypothetical protein